MSGGIAKVALGFSVTTAMTLVLAVAAVAADQTYVYEGTFSSQGTAAGEMEHPRRVAVETSTGNVLVADRDNDRIQIFAPSGNSATFLTEFGAGSLDAPFGIAINQATGDVYVGDAGNERVVKFESDGQPTPTYTIDAGFTSPAVGSAAGEVGDFEADLAVDPASGDLLVADPDDNLVQRYESDGTFVSSFDGSDSPDGSFSGLLDIDIAPDGDVYVVDSQGPVFVEGEMEGGTGPCVQNNYCSGDPSRVLRFGASGAYQSTVQDLESTTAGLVAVAPSTEQVLVGRINPQGSQKIDVYSTEGAELVDTRGFPDFFTWFPGMAVGGDAAGRLYAVTDQELQKNFNNQVGYVSVLVFAQVELPEVAIDPVGTVTADTAELSGSVDPNGTATSWRFEYRSVGDESWSTGPQGTTGEGTEPVTVEAELTDLEPSLEYEVRLVANGGGGKDVPSASVAFTTDGVSPLAVTRDASPRTTDGARINGYVNPRNDSTSYYFEWGPTAAYGNLAPVGGGGAAGSGSGQVLVSEQLTGLQPGVTYHFRLVAQNSAGVAEGEDKTFRVRSAAEMVPPQRGIELVNAPDKGNQNASGYLANEGERVIWTTMTGSPGSSQGKGTVYLSERTPSGWASHNLLPPPDQLIGDGELAYVLQAASDDYSKVIFRVGEDANFGLEGDPFYYVRYDLATGQQEQLHHLPQGAFALTGEDEIHFTSADASHLYLAIRNVPDGSSPGQVYEIGSGTPRLISVLPETGEPPACGTLFERQKYVMSKDGSRFFFLTRGDNCSDPVRIYQYDDHHTEATGDDTVVRVSTAPVSGSEGDSFPVRVSASGDTLVYYTSSRITGEDANETNDLYRWEAGSGNTCMTCMVPDPGLQISPYKWMDNAVVSPDLSHVYLATQRRLVPGLGIGHQENLYAIVGGEVRYVSPIRAAEGANLQDASQITPDGSVFTFYSRSSGITADDNGGLEQVYRYAEADDSVECMTCVPEGVPSASVDYPPRPFAVFIRPPTEAEARSLTTDGETFVFQTNTAILPQDANGGPDIYEWHNGTVQLVTDGEGEYGGTLSVPLDLEGMTKDGTDVLFRLSAQLTGFERDEVGQMFVARIGGGFPRPQPSAECSEDACQGPLEGAPPFTQPGSGTLNGPGQAVTPRHKKKPHKKCRRGTKRSKAAGKKGKCGKRKSHGTNRKPARNRGGK